MPKTTNYNLEKPSDNSTADIAVLNDNFDKIDEALFSKVNKEAGKVLSSNDFTSTEKQKLAELRNFDSSAVDAHMQNTTKHITSTERANWNNKVDKVSGKGLSSNDYTNAEKTKLANLSNYDSSTVDSHMADANKHITVAERTNWNNKVDKASGKGLSSNDYTNVEKAKVAESSSHIANVGNPHGATSEATANKIMARDSNGKTKLSGLLLSNGVSGYVELKMVNGKLGYEVIT